MGKLFKHIVFLGIGIFFGITMSKSEAISWYRIQEMFLFDSFHMYGIIGTAVFWGGIFVQGIKRLKLQSFEGDAITFSDKESGIKRYLFGGVIFGLGWALVGACPGPMFVLLGHGIWAIALVILGAILGTFFYGLLKANLPH